MVGYGLGQRLMMRQKPLKKDKKYEKMMLFTKK